MKSSLFAFLTGLVFLGCVGENKAEMRDVQPVAAIKGSASALEFLADIPSLKGVALSMSEDEFLAVVRQEKLIPNTKINFRMGKERKWKEAGSVMKLSTEKATALEAGKLMSPSEQGAFDLMRRCRPWRYLPDSACGLRLASNQNPSCHSEISFGIRYSYTQETANGQTTYWVRPKEHVAVIFGFKKGKCTGIQRMRD